MIRAIAKTMHFEILPLMVSQWSDTIHTVNLLTIGRAGYNSIDLAMPSEKRFLELLHFILSNMPVLQIAFSSFSWTLSC